VLSPPFIYSDLNYTTYSAGNYTIPSEHVENHLLLLLCPKNSKATWRTKPREDAVMHFEHKADERLMIDFAG